MSIFKSEKDIILEQLWAIVRRATRNVDDAGCDWMTSGNLTYIGVQDWLVSNDVEVAHAVNAINALNGYTDLINIRSRQQCTRCGNAEGVMRYGVLDNPDLPVCSKCLSV